MNDVNGSRTGHTATTRWERAKAGAPQAAVLATVAVIAVITSAVSYEHEYQLARRNGQAQWVSALVPFTVDGLILAAAVALAWAATAAVAGWGRLWRPRGELAVGIAATISANMFSDLRFWWLGPAVSASSGLALFLISDVAFWLLGEQRRAAKGGVPQRVAACGCPPPPVTLAEALPLARARLRDTGELAGEEALADRFRTSRHQVRTALAVPPEMWPGQDPPPPALATPNGQAAHG